MATCLNVQLAYQECKLSFFSQVFTLTDHPFPLLTLSSPSRLLSSPTCPVLESFGNKLSFETAVGLNGRVWVFSFNPYILIAILFGLPCMILLFPYFHQGKFSLCDSHIRLLETGNYCSPFLILHF